MAPSGATGILPILEPPRRTGGSSNPPCTADASSTQASRSACERVRPCHQATTATGTSSRQNGPLRPERRSTAASKLRHASVVAGAATRTRNESSASWTWALVTFMWTSKAFGTVKSSKPRAKRRKRPATTGSKRSERKNAGTSASIATATTSIRSGAASSGTAWASAPTSRGTSGR